MTSKIALHVEQYGSGDNAVVLLHGFGGSARNFRPQARILAKNRRIVLFDARGHARSAAPADASEYDFESLVTDVARVVDETGALRTVVGGLSMGAAIAYYSARAALASYKAGSVSIKTLVTPEWWLLSVLPVAFLALTLEMLFRMRRLALAERAPRDDAVSTG